MLPPDTFKTIVQNTPLISLDLLIEDKQGKILLGKRVNKPAQNYWFVPGGRIQKNEHISDAFFRITQSELGDSVPITQVQLLGIYEHFYNDAAFEGISTHYVVLAFKLCISIENLKNLPLEQHREYAWFSVEDLLLHTQVHQYTKNYFISGSSVT